MKRILVIGSGGSGKTTFSKKLAERSGLPLYHLDALYWKPGWKEPEKAEWRSIRNLKAAHAKVLIFNSYEAMDVYLASATPTSI